MLESLIAFMWVVLFYGLFITPIIMIVGFLFYVIECIVSAFCDRRKK